jgi:hypothetical protein
MKPIFPYLLFSERINAELSFILNFSLFTLEKEYLKCQVFLPKYLNWEDKYYKKKLSVYSLSGAIKEG